MFLGTGPQLPSLERGLKKNSRFILEFFFEWARHDGEQFGQERLAAVVAERRDRLAREHDRWRRATLLEPRGSEVLVGALLCAPQNPAHTAGVIFFNNTGYLGMCGHGTIGLIATLAHLGRIGPGAHVIETPVGDVTATLHDDGRVSVRNVPAYRLASGARVTMPGGQVVTGDIAWGGNWFFLVEEHGLRLALDQVERGVAQAERFLLTYIGHRDHLRNGAHLCQQLRLAGGFQSLFQLVGNVEVVFDARQARVLSKLPVHAESPT